MSIDHIMSSPLTPLPSTQVNHVVTVGEAYHQPVIPDIAEHRIILNELFNTIARKPTVEISIQGFLWSLLWPLNRRLPDSDHIPAMLSVTLGVDIKTIFVEGGVDFQETGINQRVRQFEAERRKTNESNITANFGASKPDICTELVIEIEGEATSLLSLILEIKPQPGDRDMARMAIGQAILYLLAANQSCGCWSGVAFHAGRFTRMVAQNPSEVYIEVCTADVKAMASYDEAEGMDVEAFLDPDEIDDRYPWDLGTRVEPRVNDLKVLWGVFVRSLDIVRRIPTDRPLGMLAGAPALQGEQEKINVFTTRLSDMAPDDEMDDDEGEEEWEDESDGMVDSDEEEYDLPTLLRLLSHVKVRLVSPQIMEHLVHSDSPLSRKSPA